MTERPQKPDEEAYNKALAKSEAELKTVNDKLTAIRAKIDGGDAKGSPKVQELRKQLDAVKEKQAGIKGSKAKVFEQVRTLEESIKRKIADQQATKKKLPYKSASEIDSRISSLESEVDSGKLKLVEEKKYLTEISQLKRAKRAFTDANSSQSQIDNEKANLEELRKQVEDPESKALAKQYDEIKAELDSLKSEQDQVYASRKKLYDERNALSAKSKESFLALKTLKDEYWTQKKAAIAYEKEQRQKRFDAQKQERELYEKQKRLDAANKKMEEARDPAYEVEMMTCINLMRYFDPSSLAPEDEKVSKSFGKLDIRSVEAPSDMTVLKKKEDEYFTGRTKKTKVKQSKEKFNLGITTIQELGSVGVTPPLNQEEVSATISSLKERLEWYKSNASAETERRVQKAQKEVDSLA